MYYNYDTNKYACIFQEKLDELILNYSVVVYIEGERSFPLCGFSVRSISILKQYSVDFHCENVLADYDFKSWLIEKNRWPIFPQIYIAGDFIGGYDILRGLHESGELRGILAKASPRACVA